MGFRLQYLGLACWPLLVVGCANVTPCIQMPADGKPVVVDFGDDITMRIDRVLGRDDPGRPFVVHGVVLNQTQRRWQDIRLGFSLDFLASDQDLVMVAQSASGSPGGEETKARGSVPLDVRTSVKYLGPGSTAMERDDGCAGQPRACRFKGLTIGNWQMEVSYQAHPVLSDGTCRTLVGVRRPRRYMGYYGLRPQLALVHEAVIEKRQLGLVPPESASNDPQGGATQGLAASGPSASVVAPEAAVPGEEVWRLMYDGHFEDELVEVSFSFDADLLDLSIWNRGPRALHVDWGALVWVDGEGTAMPLVRLSTLKGAPRLEAVPALIPAGARVKVMLVRDDAHLPRGSSAWKRNLGHPFVAHGPGGESQVGQTFGLYLPITVGDAPHPLDLRFRIEALVPVGSGLGRTRRSNRPAATKRERATPAVPPPTGPMAD